MSKLQIVNAKTMERLLFLLGFERVRQKGSHVFYRQKDGRTTTIPHHKGRVLACPLIREILRERKVTINEYNELLRKL